MTEIVQAVRDAYEKLSAGDPEPLLGLLDEKVEWHEAEHLSYWPGAALVGREAVLESVLAPITQDFDGFRVDVDRVCRSGDTVLVEGRYRATARSTGRPLDAQVAHVWDFRDGRAVRWRQYTDTWQFDDVAGAAHAG